MFEYHDLSLLHSVLNHEILATLDEIADSVHLSKYHFNRIFKRWAGIGPVQFLQFITLDYTKKKLAKSKSLLDASLDAGLSGPSRLHDLFVTFDAMTPGDFKKQGDGLKIAYCFCGSPFGECLIATTKKGICHFGFVQKENRADALNQLYEAWPGALFCENSQPIDPLINKIFNLDQIAEAAGHSILRTPQWMKPLAQKLLN